MILVIKVFYDGGTGSATGGGQVARPLTGFVAEKSCPSVQHFKVVRVPSHAETVPCSGDPELSYPGCGQGNRGPGRRGRTCTQEPWDWADLQDRDERSR